MANSAYPLNARNGADFRRTPWYSEASPLSAP
ncbi:hypothetical protein EDF69_001679 [Sphingomonas sp. JUb134]|nr:hypothetical protein [Sphingomonas sp. JUb134]